jgi:signal transduction histidine kinase
MPPETWDDAAPRFRPPPAVTLYVPVLIAFLVQVPATIAVSAWMHVAARWAILGVALAAASALALLAARALPGPTVAVVAVLATASLFVPPDAGPPSIALAFAIVAATVRGARVWALASVGACWLAAIVIAGAIGQTWHPFRIALVTLGLAVCFAIGEGLRTRIDRASRRRALLAERRRAAETEERTRIARELHDVLAHSLSQISVQSGVGLHLFDREPEKAREALANIRSLSATGLDEVRGVLAFLRGDDARSPRTAPLTPQPQLVDLEALVAQRNGLGLTVTLDEHLDAPLPPSAVQNAAYRIVQEALTNVVRHSAATTALVRLRRDADDLVIEVEDDGTGVGEAAEGAGRRGMRERAWMLDGTVDIADRAPVGTRVTARLPWAGAA